MAMFIIFVGDSLRQNTWITTKQQDHAHRHSPVKLAEIYIFKVIVYSYIPSSSQMVPLYH